MQSPVRIGNYLVSYDSERFRIFPTNRKGETIPVRRVNYFLYLRCVRSGELVTFKRYLHMREWFWRDSREPKPVSEREVVREVARMLFRGDESRAQDVLLAVLTGGKIPHGEPLAA